MITYLLKSAGCMLLLLLVYHAVLEREKMHRFNRYFLIFGLIFSLSVPLIAFNIGSPAQLTDQISEINSRLTAESPKSMEFVPKTTEKEHFTASASDDSAINYISILIGLYGIIASVLLIRLLRNLYILVRKVRTNPTVSLGKCTLILVDNCSRPHSFFSYIFVDKQLYQSGQIRDEVLRHERTHARQKHSVDILFVELLKVMFWFNPVLWFYKRAMQLNHEFLADEVVIANSTDLRSYQKLLLKMQSGNKELQLASSIQFSITKKRIVMMTKTTTRLRTICKQLALIPLIACLIFAFSTKTTSAQDVEQMSLTELINAVNERMDEVDSLTDEEQEKLRNLVSKMQEKLQPKSPPPPPPPMPKDADPETELKMMVEAYQEHVAYYNGIEPVEDNLQELKKIYERAMWFYNKIDELQPKVYDNPPPLPPKPLSPEKRIESHSSKSPNVPETPIKVEERNLLNIWVNWEGVILIDEEPTRLENVQAEVKEFIANKGADPDLSDSPQKARILLETDQKTPYKIYTQVLDKVQQAYYEIRNSASQAEYGVDFQKLVENSPAKTKIQEMYPVRISIADPKQEEGETKN